MFEKGFDQKRSEEYIKNCFLAMYRTYIKLSYY